MNYANELLLKSTPHAFEFPPRSNIYLGFISSDILLNVVELYLPDLQRELDLDWVNELGEKIIQDYELTKIYNFGTFDIGCLNNIYYLLNGQHRYVILDKLKNSHNNIPLEIKIYNVNTLDELHKVFVRVNGSKPSKIYTTTTKQIVINTFRRYMNKVYHSYISKSYTPRKPQLNLDNIVKYINKVELIETLKLTNADDLVILMKELNDFYRYTLMDDWKSWNVKKYEELTTKCKSKSPMNPLFVGIYDNYEWIDRILESKTKGIHYRNMLHFPLTYRPKIGVTLRRKVWNKRNNSKHIKGNCYVCQNDIDYDDFQCGHVIAVYWGGSTTIDNLEPICKPCNLDMNVENLEDFKKKLYSNNLREKCGTMN